MRHFAFLGLILGLFVVGPAFGADEAMGTVAGTTIPRPKGGFLGLEVTDNHFKLTFYDAKKKPMAVDVARAVLRWPVHYQPNEERTVLVPAGDGTSLASAKNVRAPLSFKLFIGLFVDGTEDPVETYSIDFQG